MRTLILILVLAGAVALVVASAGGQVLARGEAIPAGTPWTVETQADTVIAGGTGWILFDPTGVGVGTVDAKTDGEGTVWLYLAPDWSTTGTVRDRIGPFQLREQDAGRPLVPPGRRVHAIQYINLTAATIFAVRQ